MGLLERELASIHTKKAYHYDRLKAIKAVLKKKSSPHKLLKLSPQSQNFLQLYGISKNHVLHQKMNAYELQLHREYLDQLNHVVQFAHIRDEIPEYQIFMDAVGYGLSCGIQANKDHHVMHATLWADFGWKTLSIASAVAQGILSGTKNAVTSVVNIVRHPIETIQNLGHGIGMLGVLIGKTYACLIRWELALERGDDNDVRAQVQQTVAITNAIITHCSHELSHIPVEDKLKHSIAIATEFIVAPYIFKSIHALCSKVRPVAAGIMHALQDEQNIERLPNILATGVNDVQKISSKGKLARMQCGLSDFKNISHDMGNMHPSLKKNIHLIEELHKEVACLSKKVDKGFVPSVLENITFEKFEKLQRETEYFYNTMRLAQEDVTAIAKNTGISKEIIRNIKNHVFHQEHKLAGGIGRFDPDVDMMEAWQRLINNDFAQSDLLWLQHEFVESLIMNGLDVAYEEAHNIANKFYNWSSSLKGT